MIYLLSKKVTKRILCQNLGKNTIFLNNKVNFVGEFIMLNETDFVIKGTCDFRGIVPKNCYIHSVINY